MVTGRLKYAEMNAAGRQHNISQLRASVIIISYISGVPRNGGRGGQHIQLRTVDIENGDPRAVAPYPLDRGSGGSCNLVQESSFHIVKLS